MSLKITRIGYALRQFVQGFSHGVRSQREINAARQRSSTSPSPTTAQNSSYAVYELLARLDVAEGLDLYSDQLQEYVADGTVSEADWRFLEPELRREQEQKEFLAAKRKVQTAIRDKALSDFVRNVPAKYEFQREGLKKRVELLLWEGKRDELSAYLKDALELGIEKADQKERRDKRPHGYGLYIWFVLVGLVKVGIVLGAFSVCRTRFETVVVALLILTYQLIDRSFQSLDFFGIVRAEQARTASKRIFRLLKEEAPEPIVEREKEEQETIERDSHRMEILALIHGLFSLIIFAITLFELVAEAIF